MHLPSSSNYNEFLVYPEDSESFQRETELPSKLDFVDGLRTFEFESSTAPTVLWSSDDLDLHLEDTDDAAYIENLAIHQLQASNAARYRYPGSSATGDFLGLPQLSPDESPFSVASSRSPLTPQGGALLPDLFCGPLEDFGPLDVAAHCTPFFEEEGFMEDSAYPEQLQEDLACRAVLDMPSPASSLKNLSQPKLVLPVDDAELVHDSSSILPDSNPAERSRFLRFTEGLTENVTSQVQICISPSSAPCPLRTNVQHPSQLSSPFNPSHVGIKPADVCRGAKRRRTDDDDDDDDDDYQPNRIHKRAASKVRKVSYGSSRVTRHEGTKEERFDCSMKIHGCKKSFTRRNDMERHLGSCKFSPGLPSMTVKCPHCQKFLSRKDALLRHIKQSHVDAQ
ncbi:uncharacterized protein F5147DRAFT_714780 [Suillus discolor]|uniref:C2H2-type domain-containing protein n=1 Tax=Suillus discolor TaxID=1912936 RepID=A0A9P7EZG1_9AGAM|nr:uncharacterized protein F5147DRAFT_714780 [Suillus discolor]KAG2097732.1 hypothetical protein F5147DRAFT_714780 [Suillus discolor]